MVWLSLIIDWFSRILRGAFLAAALLCGLAICAVIVLWQVDFYDVRDRYEHVRTALFGPWQARHWCPPGKLSETCEMVQEFTDALSEASDFTFFRHTPIEGSALDITTGIQFATAQEVVGGRPKSQWCYLQFSEGQSFRRIDLASKSADAAPVYHNLTGLSRAELNGAGLSRDQLSWLARSHCRFDP